MFNFDQQLYTTYYVLSSTARDMAHDITNGKGKAENIDTYKYFISWTILNMSVLHKRNVLKCNKT
jgi:hypothetical protein